MSESTPHYSYAPSKVFPDGGRHTGGTNHHIDKEGLGVDVSMLAGLDRVNGKAEVLESTNGGLLIGDSGFYADIVNYIYYVRSLDYGLYQGPNRLYVDDSAGRHKKIVTFKSDAGPTDLAQITTLYYQISAFPTKITAIQTYYEPVSYYLDAGNIPFYDYNSAPQQSITQNP